MKTIIKNKLYSTETAKLIGIAIQNEKSDKTEELYLKRSGEYFLYVRENGTERIEPITYDRAFDWAEENIPKVKFDKEFGQIEKTDRKIEMIIRINASVREKIRREAQRRGVSMSRIVEDRFR